MKFEWDEEKNEINKAKHGIAFEDAIYVYDDPLVKKDLVITGEVPRDVKDRVKASLKGRAIDCSDIPELSDWLAPPTIVKVSLDEETAKSLRDKATAQHLTPAQAVGEMVRRGLETETV